MSDLIIVPILFGFALGFSQEMAKDLRRWFRSRRLANPMSPTRDPDWRRSFNHENTTPNSSEARPRRFGRPDDGYQPRSQGGTPNPPPETP